MTYDATYETKVAKDWWDINDLPLCSNMDGFHTVRFKTDIYFVSLLDWVVLLFKC